MVTILLHSTKKNKLKNNKLNEIYKEKPYWNIRNTGKIGKIKNQYQIQNVKPNIFDSTTKSIIKDI